MPNRFADVCYRCGELCAAGEGVFEKVGRSQAKKWPGKKLPRWFTQHHDCAVQFRGTSVHYQFNPYPKEDTMKLITKAIEQKLLKNAATPDEDHKPALKIFCPWGAATWLITEMDPEDPDILFGLCDLGVGFPELGSVSLTELKEVTGPGGLKLERDQWFTAEQTLSAYADAARAAGSITV